MNIEEKLYAPPHGGIIPVETKSLGCVSVVIRSRDGRVFNLGNPNSILFPLRLAWYKWKRRMEINNG